jgi:hypothetical protein
MATTAQSLSKAIQGLWRDRSNDPSQLPKALAFAPVNQVLGNGQFQILSNDLRLDAQDPAQGALRADNADYALGDFGYGTVDVTTQRYASLLYKLPQSVIDAIEGQNGFVNVADDAMKAVSNQILDGFTAQFVAEVTANATALGTLDLSDVTTDILAYFDASIEAIELAGSKRPTHLLMGAEAFRAFRNMDQVQGSTALGGAAAGGSFRRTGYAPMSAVGEFFRAAFGLEILVEDRTFINSAGAAAYTLSTSMVLGYAGDPTGGSVITFAKTPGFIDFDVRELSLPSPMGIGVAANAHYSVRVADADKVRRIPVTLP